VRAGIATGGRSHERFSKNSEGKKNGRTSKKSEKCRGRPKKRGKIKASKTKDGSCKVHKNIQVLSRKKNRLLTLASEVTGGGSAKIKQAHMQAGKLRLLGRIITGEILILRWLWGREEWEIVLIERSEEPTV